MQLSFRLQYDMASSSSFYVFFFLLFSVSVYPSYSAAQEEDNGCKVLVEGRCHNKSQALQLKIIAIFTIIVTSAVGIVLPLLSRSIPALRPERKFFVLIKAFASGVILATGYMHLLPDSFESLSSPCLPENPWGKFPFTAFIVMVSAIFTLMIDSYMLTFFNRKKGQRRPKSAAEVVDHASPIDDEEEAHHSHHHSHGVPQLSKDEADKGIALKRNRIIAQVLEMGIVIHSVVIGLSLGASENPCTIKPLIAALCFHQLFEGMGLGGCILVAEYNLKIKAIMSLFFSITTPFGIAIGIALSKVYDDNSPTALIVIGLLNAVSTGLLNYMALVDLLAADFMGPRLQADAKLQSWAYVAVFLGAGGMSVMAMWA